jgi:hypothetical protein
MSNDSRGDALTRRFRAAMVLGILEGKFRVVPPPLRKRIRRAKLSTLDHWFARAYFAPNLPSVFDTSVDVWALQALAEVVQRMEADLGRSIWTKRQTSEPTTERAENLTAASGFAESIADANDQSVDVSGL